MKAAALLALALFAAAPARAESYFGQAHVFDGDTLEVRGQRIRLFGIDAPESPQLCTRGGQSYPCGREAAFALADQIGQRNVTCEKRDADPYGRIVAICTMNGIDLNGWMVARGHARAYLHYSNRYAAEEARARQAHLGIWSGECEAPWDYRRRTKYNGYRNQ